MATQRTIQIPSLTSAHQARFQAILVALRAEEQLTPRDTDLLAGLIDELPQFRAVHPSDVREALQAFDQTAQHLNVALDQLAQARSALADVLNDTATDDVQLLLDSAALETLANYALTLSQTSGEVALRAQERADQIKIHAPSKA